MKGRAGKLLRRDSAIERLTKTIAAHEAGVELTTKILEDKKLSKTPEEIEKLRKKKPERAKTTLENTKNKRGSWQGNINMLYYYNKGEYLSFALL